ncbi:hypothetical protein [Paraferrimonas haliotis]|uniref:TonB-dependent receptor n=1 Tax=Paraferrimonas haliotis TaxID=2013866 RepID=A0AA37TMJ2_9GAMM|nr:hypothetical protein [Paraferrimonas haliotis]GLS82418.1 TonB-dependent receptor [Paraferrimonas haliotis]
MKKSYIARGVCAALAYVSLSAMAASNPTLTNPAISFVLDGYYQNGNRAMSEHAEGFNLGHNELALSANIDENFYGKFTTVFEMHDGETEVNVEEAFIQTTSMPYGLSVRGGRFLSDLGYLNNQHTHTDSFAERPSVYRAFLGNHYSDTGLRLNYLVPTETYWLLGVEGFAGKPLAAEDEHDHDDHSDKKVPVINGYTKIGGDIGVSHSWQLGLSYLYNANGRRALEEHHDDHMADAHDGEEHDHAHGAMYTGESMYVLDAVYKWAPNGNRKYQNFTFSGEFFRVNDILKEEHHDDHDDHDDHDAHKDYHQGWYASAVYQFAPAWSVGVRYGELDVQTIHGDHLDADNLKETDISLNWHASHFSNVRLQVTQQKGTNFEGMVDDQVISLQYTMTLGAHGAHQF